MFKRTLALFCFMLVTLAGCGDGTDRVWGGWVSEKPSLLGQHDVILLTKTQANINGKETGVIYEAVAEQVNVINAGHKNTILIFTDIKKDSATIDRSGFIGKKTFKRVPEKKVREILEALEAGKITPEKIKNLFSPK
ncbi:MAG: hypothetical protein FWF24_05245 [Alphaproteobacteria bacterium]|nr:hypothetical protein [Alphaproteobacteria bacterium]